MSESEDEEESEEEIEVEETNSYVRSFSSFIKEAEEAGSAGKSIPLETGDGSETAAGIAGDIMDIGKTKKEDEKDGEELVTKDQEITEDPETSPGDKGSAKTVVKESRVNEARGFNEHTYNEFIRDNFPKINVKKEEIGIKPALKALGVESGDEIEELTNTMDSTNTALYLTNAMENGELKELPIKSKYFEKAYLGKWKNGKPIVVFSDGWNEFVYLKEGVLKAESSLPTNKSVNEAKLKKVTKQMWTKMNDEQRVNALLTFFKDPNDAEKYFDSDWNNLPSGADGGMYIFESTNDVTEIDIDFSGSTSDLKRLSKKYGLEADEYERGKVALKGKKKDILAYLQSPQYDMDIRDIKSLFPELLESAVNEAEIKSDKEFEEYAMTVLKNAFGDEFDEAKAQEVIDGLKSKHSGDYGAMVGALQSSLG